MIKALQSCTPTTQVKWYGIIFISLLYNHLCQLIKGDQVWVSNLIHSSNSSKPTYTSQTCIYLKVKLHLASGHDIFTKRAKPNQQTTVKIPASFMEQKKHEKHFTQPLLETKLICAGQTMQVLVMKLLLNVVYLKMSSV